MCSMYEKVSILWVAAAPHYVEFFHMWIVSIKDEYGVVAIDNWRNAWKIDMWESEFSWGWVVILNVLGFFGIVSLKILSSIFQICTERCFECVDKNHKEHLQDQRAFRLLENHWKYFWAPMKSWRVIRVVEMLFEQSKYFLGFSIQHKTSSRSSAWYFSEFCLENNSISICSFWSTYYNML